MGKGKLKLMIQHQGLYLSCGIVVFQRFSYPVLIRMDI